MKSITVKKSLRLIPVLLIAALATSCVTTFRPLGVGHHGHHGHRKKIIIHKKSHHHHHAPRKKVVIRRR